MGKDITLVLLGPALAAILLLVGVLYANTLKRRTEKETRQDSEDARLDKRQAEQLDVVLKVSAAVRAELERLQERTNILEQDYARARLIACPKAAVCEIRARLLGLLVPGEKD